HSMRVILIHNAKAGDERQPDGGRLLALVRSAGHDVRYQSVREDDWHLALEQPADLVAAAGGDGTVAKIARKLIGRPVPMAILPTGTANNVARTLRLSETRLEQLVAGWETADRLKFDVAIATGP